MVNKVVSNTGPILHLNEIDLLKSLNDFSKIFIPEEVSSELRKNKVLIPKTVKIVKINPEFKDTVKIITNQYNLNIGEAEAISLCLQEKIEIFLTDDLDAREIASKYNLEVHGTVGIILRSYREKTIDKTTAIQKIRELKTNSSLFITQDLIEYVINEINEFSG